MCRTRTIPHRSGDLGTNDRWTVGAGSQSPQGARRPVVKSPTLHTRLAVPLAATSMLQGYGLQLWLERWAPPIVV